MNKYILTIILTIVFSSSALASIGDQLDGMMGSMSAFTPPSEGATATNRGYIGFGGASIKFKSTNYNIVNWQPPSFEAGCGGIDMSLGSFSFIQKDKIVQLLRDVAAMAPSYAFSLAMKSLCPACVATMEALAEKIQKFNKYFSNACQLSKGLVTNLDENGLDGAKWEEDMAALGTGAGELFDLQTRDSESAANGKDSAIAAGLLDECEYASNLIWCQMIANDLPASMTVGGDIQSMRVLMSLFGSYISTEKESYDVGGTPTGESPQTEPVIKILKLSHIIEGGEVPVYACNDGYLQTGCLDLDDDATITLEGLEQKIIRLLSDGPDSYIEKLATNIGTIDPATLSFVNSLPNGMGAMIRNIVPINKNMAHNLVKNGAKVIAYEFVIDMVRQFENMIKMGNYGKGLPYEIAYNKILDESIEKIRTESQELLLKNGSATKILREYITSMDAATKKSRYLPPSLSTGD